MTVRLSYLLIIVWSFMTLLACSNGAYYHPDDPRYSPVYPSIQAPQQPKNGSLFAEGSGLALFGNKNPFQVGDIITLTLNERTSSSKSSAVAIDKEANISLLEGAAGEGTYLGKDTGKSLPLIGDLRIPTRADQNREFSGDASADQSNRLSGSISVTVTDILENGILVVRGEKWLTLNTGDEFIRITGLLRPDDVALDNTAVSTKLANARIAYSGTGDLANSQKMGWLSRFFNGAFWPF